MYTYPSEYPDNIRRSHRMTLRCEVQRAGKGVLGRPAVLGGSVTVDRNSAVRRQLTAEFADPDGLIVPDGSDGLAAPYGNEVRVWRGIKYKGLSWGYYVDTVFEVPLGVFRIATANASDDGTHTVSVTGYDRSRAVSRNAFIAPWVIAAGSVYSDAIVALVQDRLPILDPNQDFVVTPTTLTTPLIVIDADQDPWAEVQKMADAIGMEAFFNGDGKFVLQAAPDPAATQPQWTYDDGQFSVLTQITKEATDEPGYNGVLLTSESTTLPAPIRSVVWDDNPDSPTYYLGPYGQVPMKVSSPYVTTQQQGDDMALSMLRQNSGGTEQLTFAIVPNPVHDVGDGVHLVRPGILVDSTAIIEQMTIPLTSTETMTVTTRRRRALS